MGCFQDKYEEIANIANNIMLQSNYKALSSFKYGHK